MGYRRKVVVKIRIVLSSSANKTLASHIPLFGGLGGGGVATIVCSKMASSGGHFTIQESLLCLLV